MLAWFSSRSADERKADDLYGVVVAQARQPLFYTDCGIPDTPVGRYELLVLHLALLLDRLAATGDAGAGISRALVEKFIGDMDDNMREMGVGDLSVPKKVKKAAGGLHDRTQEYAGALRHASDDALISRLSANIPELAGNAAAAGRLAAYMRSSAMALRATDEIAALAGSLAFARPHAALGEQGGGA